MKGGDIGLMLYSLIGPGSQPAPLSQLAVIAIAVLLFLVLLSLYRRREGIRHFARRAIVAEAAYLVLTLYLANSGVQPVAAVGIGVLAALALERLLVAPRGRHIRAAEKRKAIAGYERKTGRKYNPQKDELDHDVPFSKWGSSTADNLRIRPRRENRRKGNKSP
jgi:hypothetical protein